MGRQRPQLLAVGVAIGLLATGCGNGTGPSNSTTGSIQVVTTATGTNIPTTFNVSIDGAAVGVVQVGGSAVFGPFAVGDHTVELGVELNCAPTLNPRTVAVPSGSTPQTARTTFDVLCGATQGWIEVANSAAGASIPNPLNVTIDGTAVGVVQIESSATFGLYDLGDHTVELGVTSNCTVASNPRMVSVITGPTPQTAQTAFDVACVSTQGWIEVANTVTGMNIPNPFNVMVDGTPEGVVQAGGSATFGLYDVGDHTVELGVTQTTLRAT